MKRVLVALFVTHLVAGSARADDPDTEIAKRHFAAGSALYEKNDYEAAIAEFKAARDVKPAPAFDFNIARAYDRLEKIDDAITWYERYLASNPPADADGGSRERLAVLKQRVAARTPAPVVIAERPVVTPRYRYSIAAPIAVGGVALALWGAGAGLVGGTLPEYHRLERECSAGCASSRYSANQHEYQAGVGLLVAAGVVTVADVALFAARRRR